jgi:hypothetical protein
MQFPLVHNNGSDPRKLIEGFLEASKAVGKALELVEQCQPHARDYHVQSTEAMVEASKEHVARVQALIDIRTELMALTENVQDQVDELESKRLKLRGKLATVAERHSRLVDEQNKRRWDAILDDNDDLWSK